MLCAGVNVKDWNSCMSKRSKKGTWRPKMGPMTTNIRPLRAPCLWPLLPFFHSCAAPALRRNQIIHSRPSRTQQHPLPSPSRDGWSSRTVPAMPAQTSLFRNNRRCPRLWIHLAGGGHVKQRWPRQEGSFHDTAMVYIIVLRCLKESRCGSVMQ